MSFSCWIKHTWGKWTHDKEVCQVQRTCAKCYKTQSQKYHSFGKWAQYFQPMTFVRFRQSFNGGENRQKRNCLVCNFQQDELLP
jgi:hypothetical protein